MVTPIDANTGLILPVAQSQLPRLTHYLDIETLDGLKYLRGGDRGLSVAQVTDIMISFLRKDAMFVTWFMLDPTNSQKFYVGFMDNTGVFKAWDNKAAIYDTATGMFHYYGKYIRHYTLTEINKFNSRYSDTPGEVSEDERYITFADGARFGVCRDGKYVLLRNEKFKIHGNYR